MFTKGNVQLMLQICQQRTVLIIDITAFFDWYFHTGIILWWICSSWTV